jgi:hypothetical protein
VKERQKIEIIKETEKEQRRKQGKKVRGKEIMKGGKERIKYGQNRVRRMKQKKKREERRKNRLHKHALCLTENLLEHFKLVFRRFHDAKILNDAC